MTKRISAALFVFLFASVALAQTSVPTPEEFLGYKLGDRFTPYDRILDYFNELTKRSPLITVEKFGETYEGRPLVLATITSAANRAKLDQIRRDVFSLANGDVDANKAGAIAKSAPAIVWLAYGVHGNESSSSEAAMRVASMLLRDPDSQRLLDDVVVLIDPLQNPDGRERYVQWFTRTRGADPDPNPESFEHQEPWPGGRFNHYLIDMNRDWTWISQRETQARVAKYREWNPQVFVDLHEMGTNSTYFFPPDAKPINVNLPRDVEKWLEVFGRANAEQFNKRGWPFFVAERFDLFYPGYGDSWPSLHGAIGMTYEVAGGGRAGTTAEREDETKLELAHRLDEHTTTSMTTIRTAAANREALLKYTYDAIRSQIDGGKNTYFISTSSPNAERMIELLQKQGVRVGVLASPVTTKVTKIDSGASADHTFPAGTAVISTKQPLGRLAETLLEKSPIFSKGFVEEQRQKTAADEPDDFYDLTTWSLPLAMNVETYVASTPLTVDAHAYEMPARAPFHAASYGYLVDANDPNLYRFAGRMLANNINFSVSAIELTANDRTWPRGTLIVLKGNNKSDVDATLDRISREMNTTPATLETGWSGVSSFGSEDIHYVKPPHIALVGGNGVGATSYGMLWHTLDIDTPIPHTNLSLDSLRGIDLSHYRVLILPDGESYGDRLGKNGLEKLKTWIRDGGTVVTVGDAGKFLRDKDADVSKLKPWAPKKDEKDKKDDEAKQDERYNEPRVPGAAFRTVMNDRSYLTFGVPRPPAVLIEGSNAFTPVAHKVDNVVTIDAKDPLVSGVAWPESLDRLKGAIYLVSEPYGRGNVITFADQPNYRLFWRATLPLFLNAVLYSPSFPR